jgi:DNA-directed RNA polymerase subunit RPC12/RpoP
MGLIEKFFGSKKDDGDKFWTETDYGFAPKESVKIRYSPSRDAFRGIGSGVIIDGTIEEYQRVKALEKKIFEMVPYLTGSCVNCQKNFIIPEAKKPIYFKCPFCSPAEEKALIELLLFMNPENEIFAKCPECSTYSYIEATKESRYVNFHCKSCQKDLVLKKDHPIVLGKLSPNSTLSWCSACGLLFESPLNEKYPITCSRCESRLEPK